MQQPLFIDAFLLHHYLSNWPVRVVKPSVFRHARVVGTSSCNGIVCLNDHKFVYLWNPSIRMCKIIRVPKLYVSRLNRVKIGFGYDSTSNDYMVFQTYN